MARSMKYISDLNKGIRVEWCKAFARLRRWQEQIPLVREEMRRTLVSLAHRADGWRARATADKREGALGEGARAYALAQQRAYKGLGEHFRAMWAAAPGASSVDLSTAMELEAALEEDEAMRDAEDSEAEDTSDEDED